MKALFVKMHPSREFADLPRNPPRGRHGVGDQFFLSGGVRARMHDCLVTQVAQILKPERGAAQDFSLEFPAFASASLAIRRGHRGASWHL